eukprot:CAMPEP_0115692536 /NCGR_PEP_ID=MMETSP0272-20121206/63249_1 /TAXON_ID=71861 /ORGANISM="Scrippsiella trochoidea, Strain CCMP3099" /LENGTH=115 /DNA_ID=CAMNT_0003132603 /DNA_START=202 /DNA_END=545 /DNA_ORIENTATION=-
MRTACNVPSHEPLPRRRTLEHALPKGQCEVLIALGRHREARTQQRALACATPEGQSEVWGFAGPLLARARLGHHSGSAAAGVLTELFSPLAVEHGEMLLMPTAGQLFAASIGNSS